jgi:hypothetical protein
MTRLLLPRHKGQVEIMVGKQRSLCWGCGNYCNVALENLDYFFCAGDQQHEFGRSFDPSNFECEQAVDFFRFTPGDLERLRVGLRFPAQMEAVNGYNGHGTKASGMCVFACVLVCLF